MNQLLFSIIDKTSKRLMQKKLITVLATIACVFATPKIAAAETFLSHAYVSRSFTPDGCINQTQKAIQRMTQYYHLRLNGSIRRDGYIAFWNIQGSSDTGGSIICYGLPYPIQPGRTNEPRVLFIITVYSQDDILANKYKDFLYDYIKSIATL